MCVPGPVIGEEDGKGWLRVTEIYPGDTRTNQLLWAEWERAGYLNKLGSARKEEGGTDAGEGGENHFELF